MGNNLHWENKEVIGTTEPRRTLGRMPCKHLELVA